MANLDSIDLSISKGTLNEIDGSILDGQDVISTERLHKNDTLMGTVLAASSKDTRELQFALSLLESLVKRYPGNASIVKQRDRVRMMVNLRNTCVRNKSEGTVPSDSLFHHQLL